MAPAVSCQRGTPRRRTWAAETTQRSDPRAPEITARTAKPSVLVITATPAQVQPSAERKGGRAKQLRLTGEFSPTNIRSGPVLLRRFCQGQASSAPRFQWPRVTHPRLKPLWCAWELVGTSPSPALLHRCARSPTQRRRKQVPLILPPRHVAAATPLPNPRPSARTDCSSARVEALSPPPSSSAAPLHASITPIPATTAGVFGAGAESRV